MKIISVAFILVILICLFVLIYKLQNKLKERLDQLESENVEQNKRLIALEKKVKKIEIGSTDEKRDSIGKNQNSYKFVRRNR